MKKKYEKPVIEVEFYTFTDAIAKCDSVVNIGPTDPAYPEITACSDYTNNEGLISSDVPWYDNETYPNTYCSCYHTAGGSNLLSS